MEESLKRPRFLYLITAYWQQWQRVSQSVSQSASQSVSQSVRIHSGGSE